MNKRLHVLIEGRVQGVSFRAFVRREAQRHTVGGWVRNRDDGSVEAVFEGEADAVDAVVARCYEGPSLARVADVQTVEEHYTGDFTTFEIRR